MTTTTMTSVNGIDIEALAQATDAMKKTPRLAALQFRSVTDWKDGAVSVTTFAGYAKGETGVTRSKPHTLAADEPPALLGTGTQVGPTGHLLHALSHSLAVTIAYFGAERGVEINSLRIDADGTLDLQGLLGLDDRIRPGFKHIHVDVNVDSRSAPDAVRDLVEYAQGRAPIVAAVTQATNVEWAFDINATDSGPDEGAVRHGVNAANLVATVQAIQQTPVLGQCRFYNKSEWLGGARVASVSPGFDQAQGALLVRHRDPAPKGYTGDEPPVIGDDSGPAAAEALLQAMAGCLSVTTSYHAAARGIRLEALRVEWDGDVDAQGFADLDDRVSPGFERIRGRIAIRAGGATRDELEAFLRFTIAHSPMIDSVRKPVHVTYALTLNGRSI